MVWQRIICERERKKKEIKENINIIYNISVRLTPLKYTYIYNRNYERVNSVLTLVLILI